MDDLFDLPLLTGLCSVADFVEADEERGLIERIDSLALAPFRFQGWLGKRLTHSFGIHYDFDRAALARTDPLPPWLAAVRDRAERAVGLAPGTLEQALLIRYDPGAGIGWHRDRPHFDHVVGVSLGAPASSCATAGGAGGGGGAATCSLLGSWGACGAAGASGRVPAVGAASSLSVMAVRGCGSDGERVSGAGVGR